MRVLPSAVLMLACVVAAGLTGPAFAQVDYDGDHPWNQRANSGPDAAVPGWFYNLGVTGIRARLVPDAPRTLRVEYVFEGSPADEAGVRRGDSIVGAYGREFRQDHQDGYGMSVFGARGPIGELAEAIEHSLGQEQGGELPLLVRRDGEAGPVTLELDARHGQFGETFPADCEKSRRIYRFLCRYLVEQQGDNGSFGNPVHNTFAPLALLASGERRYLPAVRSCLEHLMSQIDRPIEQQREGLWNWTYMGTAIVMSEYYLLTEDRWALPHLQMLRDRLEHGQYMDMSQINPRVRETHPDAYPSGPMDAHGGWGHNPGFEGYGPIAMITGQGALAFALMHRCGIEIDEDRMEAALAFLDRATAPNGYVWYADDLGGGPDAWADMGRTGASGIAHALSPFHTDHCARRAMLHAQVIGQHPESFPDTHGSPAMGMGYAAMAANVDPRAFRRMMDANRWWFTMAQCGDDGTFYYQPNRDNAGYDARARMTASCVVAFIFAIPDQTLVITGREHREDRPDADRGGDEPLVPRVSPDPPSVP